MARERPDATTKRPRAGPSPEPEKRSRPWMEDAELKRSVNAAVQDEDEEDDGD